MAEAPLLLAVDGGQTATKALVARLDGTILGAGRGGPSDHFHIEGGVEKNRTAIQGAIAAALAAAGAAGESVAAIGLGLTGAPARGAQTPIVFQIVREVLATPQVTVVPDYVTNLAGASGGEPGVVLIAGGGAIGYGVTAEGREAIAGGYGFLLGDEGSAFDVGLRAIAAAARADDRRGEPTALQAIVEEHFGIAAIRQITRVVYAAGFSRERISLLAPKVTQAARDGDAAALAVMRAAGEELAQTALGVIRQLFAPAAAVGVYLTGGVFAAGDVLLDPFRASLRSGWPMAEPREPRFPPAVGGLIIAARSVDRPVDAAWLDTVAASLPAVEA
ncbi:MAG TPA: BadF/BadG/BcrA/BcrD ATPase family protein [Thermomicrobiales bacterium]